ncbi:MAG: hypothetical protein PHS86_09275, partial [Syntrophaceae bacterium]|nr:hypothetical protein [Syntrophaceae bacterium]
SMKLDLRNVFINPPQTERPAQTPPVGVTAPIPPGIVRTLIHKNRILTKLMLRVTIICHTKACQHFFVTTRNFVAHQWLVHLILGWPKTLAHIEVLLRYFGGEF